MRKALGCVLSVAALAGCIGAPVPAWAKNPAGTVVAPGEARGPFPNVVITSAVLREEALSPTVAAPGAGRLGQRTLALAGDESGEDPAPRSVLLASDAPLVEPVSAPQIDKPATSEKPAAGEATPAVEAAPAAENKPAGEDKPAAEAAPADSSTPAETAAPASSGAPAGTATPGETAAPTGDGAPASDKVVPTEEGVKDGEVAAPEGTPSASNKSCLFSGVVESVSAEAIKVSGTDHEGKAISLDFIVDTASQMAEGIKTGDTVSVFYEVASTGGFRVSSARYATGTLPRNIFPSDLESTATNTDTAVAGSTASSAAAGTPTPSDVPRVVSIEVEGNKTVSDEEVLQVVTTRIGDPLLEPRIRRDMQAIYDSGFYSDVRLDTRYASGGVRIVFRVLENPVVNEINISGNSVVATEKLRELMKTETGRVFNTRVLQSDLEAINKYYNEELGYVVSPSHVTKLDLSDGVLSLQLVDGVEVKEVKITGVTVFPQEKVDSLVQTKSGQLFNRKLLSEDSDRIYKLYEDSNFILDTIKPSLDVDTGVVSLNVVEAVLQEVKVTGNTRTKTETILRNIRTKPGEVMRRDKIQRDMERLNNLGFFKKVEPTIEPGSQPGNVIFVLEVEEQKTGLATVGVGYAGGGSGAVRPGITGAVSYSERNLFGEGKSISVNLQRGGQIGSYGISYYDPAINAAQDSIGVSVYYNNVDEVQQSVTGAEYGTYAYYDQKVYGGTFTYGHPFSDDFRGFVTLRHETIDLKASNKTVYVPLGMGKGDLNAISFTALYDTRDDVFTPHKGSYLNATFSYAGEFLGGSYDYTKIMVEGRHYIPITKRSTIAVRGLYGSVGNGAPGSEYFYAGGTDTMRGYEDNAFFGTKTILLNAEYRFPIANIKMLSGAVFVDAGNAWISGQSNNKLYTDAGVGLRIVFPNLGLGVIRIDYAFGQDGSRSSIGIGQSF